MSKVVIEVTLKKRILINEAEWVRGFDELLPSDMEELEMLEDKALGTSTKLIDVKYLGESVEKD